MNEKFKAYIELLNARITLAMIYQNNGSPDYCKELKEKMYQQHEEAEQKIKESNEYKRTKQKTRR